MKVHELRRALIQSIRRQGWTTEQIKDFLRNKGISLTKKLVAEIGEDDGAHN